MPKAIGYPLILCVLFLAACGFADRELHADAEGEEQDAYLPLVTNAPAQVNDLVFTNGAIYTVNPEQPWVEAVAIRDGVILAVGNEQEALAAVGDDPGIIDLDGLMMMPGVQDPHLHVLEAGLNEHLCFVSEVAEFDRYIREVRTCATQQPDSEWVRAAGANMADLLARARLPIDVLDEAVPDRPVIILDDLGHGAWLNTLAMQAVGYDVIDGDPPGGIIVRDPDSGALTGIVLENAQQKARTASLPPENENLALVYEGLLDGLDQLARNGITSVSDAGGYWPRGHRTVWQRAEDEGTLTARASNALYLFSDRAFDEQLAELQALYTNDPDSLLRFNQAKIYVDGILSQGTAALLEPYDNTFDLPDVPDDGFLYFNTETLNQYARDLDAAGFQLHFHVTGDRGARLALDAIEGAIDSNGDADRRHRLTHLYLIDNDDRSRFDELGVIADFQLAPSSTDPGYADYMAFYIGDRANDLLPAFDMLDRGVTVTLSSDWGADQLSPFEKMESILLQDVDDTPALETIIRMMTLDVAHLLHQEDMTGTIEPGKFADLIVLDRNLFETPARRIGRTEVLLTLLEGNEIYRHRNAP